MGSVIWSSNFGMFILWPLGELVSFWSCAAKVDESADATTICTRSAIAMRVMMEHSR
jgi:hypothetical protein